MLFNFVRVGDAFKRLIDGHEAATSCHVKRLNNQPTAEQRQLVVKGGCRVISGYGVRFNQQHRACVQPGVHLHDGDARLQITRLNSPVNWRCAAPSWQQRCVNVQATKPGRVKHPLRQDQAISRHYHHIGPHRVNRRFGGQRVIRIFAVKPQAARLYDWCVVH